MGLMFDTPTFELHANHGPLMIRVAIVVMVLSFSAVFLRFLSRRLVKQPALWDDWMIIVALAFAWVTCIWEIIAVHKGKFGQHAQLATPESATNFFKALYVVQLTYLIAIACIKFSIMLFYRRLFKIPPTRIPLMILAGVVGAWLISTILVGVFSCKPIDGFWMKTKPSKCINDIRYFLAVAVPNITTDVILIIFPMPMVWKLNVSRSQKIALSCIFLLGSFIIVVSCLRLVSVVEANGSLDFTWALLPLGIWNAVETNVGICCACLPSMRPLLRILLRQNKTLVVPSDQSTPRRYWPSKRATPFAGLNASFTWLNDTIPGNEDGGTRGPTTTIQSTSVMDTMELKDLHSTPGIHVEHNVEQNVTWT